MPEGEILIMAGDIVPFRVIDEHKDFFSSLADNFEEIYWIPGNHEYYYADINQRSGQFLEKISANIHLLNDSVIEKENVRLVFSTLWSKISPQHYWTIRQSISDFQVIRNGEELLSPDKFNELHDKAFRFLKQTLSTPFSGKTIVATHHVPTLYSYPEEYRGDIINEAFAVELYSLIEAYGPDYWIYGHHHRNIEPFEVGNTALLTNQLGYVNRNEHSDFKRNKVIALQ